MREWSRKSRQRRTAWLALTVVLAGSGMLRAQDRMPPIPEAAMTLAQREAVAEFKAARGVEVSGPFVPLLRSPEVMSRARAMGDYLRYRSVLPPRLSEFVILLTARTWSQGYEWNLHAPIAVAAGVPVATATAIGAGRRPDQMTPDETLLYDVCAELDRNKTVSDPTYAKLVARFGEQGVIDVVGLVGYYTMIAMAMNVTRTPAGEPAATPLFVLPR